MTKLACLVVCMAIILCGFGATGAEGEAMSDATDAIQIGSGKQLMIDRRFIATSEGVELTMNPPRKAGMVLAPDKPWESKDVGFCVSVVEHDGLFKMWYMARDSIDHVDPESIRYCYATSTDGVHWDKPILGIHEYAGSKDNNIVLTGVIESTVFLDPVAPPEARFKSISAMHWPDPDRAGLYVHMSPDGIHWTMSEQRVFPVYPDTANQAFYDTRLEKYVAHIRVWDPLRKIGRVEMDDITKPWPCTLLDKPYCIWGEDKVAVTSREVPIVFGYDEHDPADSDHYNPACVQYPWADNAYFMFPSPYRHTPPPPGNDGYLDIQMAVSRDDANWVRPTREPYVPLGRKGASDSCQMYMVVGMVRTGDIIHQYYGGYDFTHGQFGPKANGSGGIHRLEQRLDGFMSADAPMAGGTFTTPSLAFSGSKLVLNLDASAMGTCRVALLNADGSAVEGYGADDCDVLEGNSTARIVTWKGESNVSALSGRPVRLRFQMFAVKLYAFQFVE
ncbi:MAG: hypothetical protein GY851_29435 [bacterium]|nr:hypothetical protein [bacterium]